MLKKQPDKYLFISERVPRDFVNLVKYINRRILEDEHGRCLLNNYEKGTDLLLSLSLDSFKQLVLKLKSKVEVKNPIAYLFYWDFE